MKRCWSVVGCVVIVATAACGGDPAEEPGGGPGGASSGSGAGTPTGTATTGSGGGSSATTGSGGSSSTTGSGGSSSSTTGDYFPNGSWIYEDITNAPLRSDSSAMTQWLEDHGGWGTGKMRIDFSIEVLHADATTPQQSFQTTGDFFSPDCDQVPVPIPPGGALEGEQGYACTSDGDCHLIVRDDSQQLLFEMWRANITGNGFDGGCLAVWDMTKVYGPQGRGEQCTSADAAGFPMAPMLFTADEVAAGEIKHAIRFILPNARMRGGTYTHPATHAGGPSGPSPAPVYGSRWRLRADFDLNSLPNEGARVVARAMQHYGMALADGGNIALTAQSDRFTTATWDGLLGAYDLSALQPTDFEVIDTGADINLTNDCVREP